jgi:hypothetical protein
MSSAESATGLLWVSDHLISVVRWGLEGKQSQLSREEMAILMEFVAKHIGQAIHSLEGIETARAA